MVKVTAYIPSSSSYILPSSCLFPWEWWIQGNPLHGFSLFIVLSWLPHLITNGSATFPAYTHPTDPKAGLTLVLLGWGVGVLQHITGSLESQWDLFPDSVKWQLYIHPCWNRLKSEGSNSLKQQGECDFSLCLIWAWRKWMVVLIASASLGSPWSLRCDFDNA